MNTAPHAFRRLSIWEKRDEAKMMNSLSDKKQQKIGGLKSGFSSKAKR